LRRSLIALPVVAAVVFLGALGWYLYIYALWKAGNYRCGKEMQRYGGWHIGFNGKTDTFVCTVNDAKLQVVAREEIPVDQVMGTSGGWPLFPELVAHELESMDDDLP
jgi:hypothetical protein